MNIGELLGYGRAVLREPNEAGILLADILEKSRDYFVSHPETSVSRARVFAFQRACKKRANGFPLAYLTHHREFYGLDFYVDKRVLIPRPETELLVKATLEVLREHAVEAPVRHPYIVEIGTGSGCIAIALARNLPAARITAVDIDSGALAVARINAKTHVVSKRVRFLSSDLLARIPDEPYSAIVANLPYIGTKEHRLIAKDVLVFEPHTALFGGKDGLELYQRLFEQLANRKHRPDFFAGEMGFSQKDALSALIRKYFGKVPVVWKNDLAVLPRIFIIKFFNTGRHTVPPRGRAKNLAPPVLSEDRA